jgi:2-dehydro-3-deoxygluconokinase
MTMEVVTLGEPLAAFLAVEPVALSDAGSYRFYVAGAESNVAIGLARLGHAVAFVGRVGEDGLGTAIVRRLRGEGVEVTGVTVEVDAPTGVMIREHRAFGPSEVTYRRADSAGARLAADDLVRSGGLRGASWVHLTGITPALSGSARGAVDSAIDQARQAGATVSFDVNLRRRLWSTEVAASVLGAVARRADVVLGSPDELELVAGGPEGPARLLDDGVALVVTKAGAAGARSIDNAGRAIIVNAFPVQTTVDPVGAGDAFCAGFIAARLRGHENELALTWGAACGAAVAAVAGDIDGLPTSDELNRILERGQDTIR